MIALDREDCVGCHACVNSCPQKCISMENDEEGFWYPTVDRGRCTECTLCIKACPIINRITVQNKPLAYACINTDEDIRLRSSSGGVFTLIAEQVIESGGVVFGAGFNRELAVEHGSADSILELAKFRGSKYVQSRIGHTYKHAKSLLDLGRKVLFTGTPCQIAGLKSYLGRSYENLLCADIICHGVPSPNVWRKYIEYQEEQNGAKIQKISFRRKDDGWKRYSVSLLFDNDTEYRKTLKEDLFLMAFLKDVCLRPSCYACKFKTLNRMSDITLGDFWGIQEVLPDMDDDKGTSLIFVNSKAGQALFEQIADRMRCKEVDISEAVNYNSAAVKSVRRNTNRDHFFRELHRLPFDQLVKRYCTDKMHLRISRRLRATLKPILVRLGLFDPLKRLVESFRN